LVCQRTGAADFEAPPWARILLHKRRYSKHLAAGVDTAFAESVQSRNYPVVLPMLTLSYSVTRGFAPPANSSAPAPALAAQSPLGAIAFGVHCDAGAEPAAALAIDAPVLAPAPLAAAPLFEIWRDGGSVHSGRRDALDYCYNERLLFGRIAVAEAAFSADDEATRAADHPEERVRTALQRATAVAYRQIFAVLDACAFPHLWRVWNFIPQINVESAGLERYRQFNIDRQAAFSAAGRAALDSVPAASAVGSSAGPLAIYFFAGRAAPRAIENPRQLSAYHYPSEYGPRSPLFARASLIDLEEGEVLFVSGTASIVGHRTLHIGDAHAQTVESLANIDAILAAANEQAQRRKFVRGDLAYKIYLRHAADLETVRRVFDAWLGAAGHVVYVQADICRAELLVEIEASAGHRIEPAMAPRLELAAEARGA
jgi:enamine deaminase RidA (YjgF/YER057c/UK114 family)